MSRPTVAYVELDNIRQNIKNLQRHIGNTKMMCMVKADAYGHGLVQVARTCSDAGAYALGVAATEEGVQLRQAGIDLPILCVGACFRESAHDAVMHDITQTVYDVSCLEALQSAAEKTGKKARVHIKIDSGMARLGVQSEQELLEIIKAVRACPDIAVTGAFTHFAASDSADKGFTHRQAEIFNGMLRVLEREGFTDIIRHASCSGAVLDCPELRYDMVRPGIAIYGYYPSREVRHDIILKPALRLESRLTQVKSIGKGQSIGYGRSFVAPRDMRIGIVPIGYGDGYRRGNSNKGYCVICGRKAPICGRVCMDQLMADITDIPDASPGALVTLIGQQDGVHIWADEMADICDTISYEILLNISKRVPKVYCGRKS